MVEATGVEPVSENPSIQLSTSVLYLLFLPLSRAGTQAQVRGSPEYTYAAVGSSAQRSPLVDALTEAVVLIGRTLAD